MGAAGSMLDAARKTLRLAAMLASGALHAAAPPDPPVESHHVEALWIRYGGADQADNGEVQGLLTAPPGWTSGDAAAVAFGDAPGTEPARARLFAALLADGAAVLELDVSAPSHQPPGGGPISPPPRSQDLRPRLFEALLVLRRDYGAGLVVAIGFGPDGEAVLRAGDEAAAAHRVGGAAPRFAALAFLGPGQPRFVPGPAPRPDEDWPARAGPLCAILASAVAGPSSVERGPARDAERSCLAALLPPRPDRSTARTADDAD